MTYRRQERRKIDLDFGRFRAVEVDTVVEFNDVDNSQLLRECIALESNLNHQKILLYLGAGHCYDFIADKLQLSRKNIRNCAFDAKKKLIDRLAKKGLNVSNNKKVHRYIDIQFKTENSPMYDDYPFTDSSFYNQILFVLKKENKPLDRHELVSTIARNRGKTFNDCRGCMKYPMQRLMDDGVVKFDGNKYSLFH
jgi:hypothetical protein